MMITCQFKEWQRGIEKALVQALVCVLRLVWGRMWWRPTLRILSILKKEEGK